MNKLSYLTEKGFYIIRKLMVDLKLLSYLESYLTENRKQRFNEILNERTRYFTVATEDLYQLHNTSAVIRSCDIFGIQDLHLIQAINASGFDREIAMGSQKWVNVYRYRSATECILSLRDNGYQIVATTPHNGEVTLDDFDFTSPSCFFFGRETEGLTKEVMNQADCFLKIPMYGFTESLNISVAAAIVMQHVIAKLRRTDLKWQLNELERAELKMDWIKKTIKSFDKIVERYQSEN
jgi:tRNA (guanosine-2'-O-)-methyltransferase